MLRHRAAHLTGPIARTAQPIALAGPTSISVAERRETIDVQAELAWCVAEAKRLGVAAEGADDLRTALAAVGQVRGVVDTMVRAAELLAARDRDTSGRLSDEELERRREAVIARILGERRG